VEDIGRGAAEVRAVSEALGLGSLAAWSGWAFGRGSGPAAEMLRYVGLQGARDRAISVKRSSGVSCGLSLTLLNRLATFRRCLLTSLVLTGWKELLLVMTTPLG